MNHDPKEHFSDEQIEVISSLFESKINAMLVKTIGTYIITMLLCAVSIGGAYMRLGAVEDSVASVGEIVRDNLPSKEYVDTRDANIQLQVNDLGKRLDRIETKLDVIIERL